MSDWSGIPEGWGKGHYRDVPICKLVEQARLRQVNDLRRSVTDPSFPYYFDDEAADRAVRFMQALRHVEGRWAGQPFILADWQEWDIVRPLFGWRRRADNKRRFRIAYIEIPRKNGKSSLAAAISCYLFLGDREFGAQVFAAATKEEQAKIVWGYGKRMMQLSPELRKEFSAFKTSLYNEKYGSVFRPLGRDSKTQDGLNVHGGIIDEYHAHQSADMYNVLWSGRGAREQPLLVIITTAGHSTESPCRKESEFAKQLLQGLTPNETYFAYVATVDDPAKWDDPIEWAKANPNWGISLNADIFEEDYKHAAESPIHQNEFKCKRLNIWTEQATRWINMARWKTCGGAIDWSAFKGRPCWIGVDLGLTGDIAAACVAFQALEAWRKYDEQGIALPLDLFLKWFFWVPEVGIKRKETVDRVPYIQWKEQGIITATPGEVTRIDYIRRDLNALAEEYQVLGVALDIAHAAELMQNLKDDGLNVLNHSQGMKAMTFGCVTLDSYIQAQRLHHGGNPVASWMAANVAAMKNSEGMMKICKAASGDRVDGMTAAVMAAGRLLIEPAKPQFVYNSRGMYSG